MHELSIAMNILEIAQEEACRRNVQVSAVHVKIGALSGIVPDALLGSYEIARCGTVLENSRLLIEEVPVVIDCPACGKRQLDSIQLLACPRCGAPAWNIVQGKELEVVALEVM